MIFLIAAFPGIDACHGIDDFRRLCLYPPGCRWQSRSVERFHLTLAELHIDESRLPQVQAILEGLRMPLSDCLIRIPKKAGPVHELKVRVPPAFRRFRDQMHAELTEAGFQVLGGKRPHLTLSYHFVAHTPGATMRDIAWVVDGLRLVWSQREPEFPRAKHVIRGEYPAVEPAQARLFA